MSDEKRRYKAMIAGRTYTIVGKKSEQHLKTVSEIANDTIAQLMAAQPNLDIEQRAILVAVNTISKNIAQQTEIDALNETNNTLEKKNEQLRRRIQTLQNQSKKTEADPTEEQDPKVQEQPQQKQATKPKTKFVKPTTTTASAAVLKKAGQQEQKVSLPFTGKKGLPAASKKKLESKAAQKKSPLENR